jgi:hypothetical protein
MASPTTNKRTRREWRELGFFYDRDDDAKCWLVKGSGAGVLAFVTLLRAYGRNPRNGALSEHEHYGPYQYLKFMTWTGPRLDGHAIQGRLDDFDRLAGLVESKLRAVGVGAVFEIGTEYSSASEYVLRVQVAEDGFDPAAADPSCQDGQEP